MKTGQPIAIVDAFTETPFRGNPAAVCLCRGPLPDDRMQRIAGEMNLSETAFVDPDLEGGFFLRWFTPRCEVELCGHATLAAAHLLWEEGRVPADEPIRFQTRSGPLTCRSAAGEITMDFPRGTRRLDACPPQTGPDPGDLRLRSGRAQPFRLAGPAGGRVAGPRAGSRFPASALAGLGGPGW